MELKHKCAWCGETFTTPDTYRGRQRLTCSRHCSAKYGATHRKPRAPQKSKKIEMNCIVCGSHFLKYPSAKDTYCCSDKCARIKRSQTIRERWSGSNNWAWKGGRVKSSGYIFIQKRTHPHVNSSGYVAEHRLVMEKHLGRYLSPTERVHHINGIRDDNRLENLMVMTSAKAHKAIHPNVVCPYCHREFILVNSKPIEAFS